MELAACGVVTGVGAPAVTGEALVLECNRVALGIDRRGANEMLEEIGPSQRAKTANHTEGEPIVDHLGPPFLQDSGNDEPLRTSASFELLRQPFDGEDTQLAVLIADLPGLQVGWRTIGRLSLFHVLINGQDDARCWWRARKRDRLATRCEPFLAALGKRLVGKWKVFLWYPSGEDRGSDLLACCW